MQHKKTPHKLSYYYNRKEVYTMPYDDIKDTCYGFTFDECEVEFVSDTEYYEYLESLDDS